MQGRGDWSLVPLEIVKFGKRGLAEVLQSGLGSHAEQES